MKEHIDAHIRTNKKVEYGRANQHIYKTKNQPYLNIS